MLSRLRKVARFLVAVSTGLARLVSSKGGRSRGGGRPIIEITIFRYDVLPAAAAAGGGAQ